MMGIAQIRLKIIDARAF